MRLQARDWRLSGMSALLAAVALLSLSGPAAAVCTEWKQEGTSQEDMNDGYSGDHEIAFEELACPADAPAPCPFERGKPHHIVVVPDMYAHTHGVERLLLDSPHERDVILELARDGYRQQAFAAGSGSDIDPEGATARSVDFKLLEETVYPFRNVRHAANRDPFGVPHATVVPYTDSDRTVEPGSGAKLKWKSFWRTSTGVLSGCSNETLNGLRVTIGGPYLTINENTNSTTIAGTWAKSKSVAVGPKNDGASLRGMGGLGGAVLGCAVAVLISSFMA
ncbi:hypothetical protein PG985_008320 [Apiospora marii]|uniref:Secreted protein n=1 Tax=Apiospora marii TaxID=335849 RepID=A0ABR1SRL3_9PEZI